MCVFYQANHLCSHRCFPFLAHQIWLMCCHQHSGLESPSLECEDEPGPCTLNFEGDRRVNIALGHGGSPCLPDESKLLLILPAEELWEESIHRSSCVPNARSWILSVKPDHCYWGFHQCKCTVVPHPFFLQGHYKHKKEI